MKFFDFVFEVSPSDVHLGFEEDPELSLQPLLFLLRQSPFTLVLDLQLLVLVELPEVFKELLNEVQAVQSAFVVLPAAFDEVRLLYQHFLEQVVESLIEIVLSLRLCLEAHLLLLLVLHIRVVFLFLRKHILKGLLSLP